MDKRIVFFDLKYYNKDIISISLCTLDNIYFYAELNDINESKLDIKTYSKYIPKLKYRIPESMNNFLISSKRIIGNKEYNQIEMNGNIMEVSNELNDWLLQFTDESYLEMYSYNVKDQYNLMYNLLLKTRRTRYLNKNICIIPDNFHDLVYDVMKYLKKDNIYDVKSLKPYQVIKKYIKDNGISDRNHIGRRIIYKYNNNNNSLNDVYHIMGLYKTFYRGEY